MMTGMGSLLRRPIASACLLAAACVSTTGLAAEKSWVYVGTYTNSKTSPSEGIYRLEFDPETGTLTPKGTAAKVVSPSFLAIHPSGKFLYSVGEIDSFEGEKAGGVSAFSLEPVTGELRLINQQSSKGTGPCHLTVDPSGKMVVVANYGGGSVASLPIAPDGSLKPAASAIQHEGSGPDPGRQKGPHAHSVNFDPTGRLVLAADLGLDKVLVYDADAASGKIAPHAPAFAATPPGTGPRHLAWAPSGDRAYVITELKNTIEVFDYDEAAGTLKLAQSISTLPADFAGKSYCAEVVAHPSGKFVYGSNRGADSLAIFRVDPAGKLVSAGWAPTVKNPRNFVIDPTGGWLLAAGQDSDTILIYKVDAETGGLTPTGAPVAIPKPVCIRFASRPSSPK